MVDGIDQYAIFLIVAVLVLCLVVCVVSHYGTRRKKKAHPTQIINNVRK